jgi:hypothetical protein
MIVSELIALLTRVDPSAQVVVEYDAGCCLDEDLGVRLDGRCVVIETDATFVRRSPERRQHEALDPPVAFGRSA